MWTLVFLPMFLDLRGSVVNILVYLTCESTETGAITQRILYRDLFNQNGMDFVTEISVCKSPVVGAKSLVFRGWKSAREII